MSSGVGAAGKRHNHQIVAGSGAGLKLGERDGNLRWNAVPRPNLSLDPMDNFRAQCPGGSALGLAAASRQHQKQEYSQESKILSQQGDRLFRQKNTKKLSHEERQKR